MLCIQKIKEIKGVINPILHDHCLHIHDLTRPDLLNNDKNLISFSG